MEYQNKAQFEQEGKPRRLPFVGAGIVFRRQMRGRSWRKDALWAGLMLAGLLACAAILQKTWAETNFYSGNAPEFPMRWLTMGAVGACGVFLPLSAIVGASAVPASEEAENTQAMLLTRLSASAICAGRLAAACWPLFLALLLSCGFWTVAQVLFHFAGSRWSGLLPIWEVHLVAFCAVYMVSAIAFLCAVRRRPGRAWWRGTGIALIAAGWCVTALFLLDKKIQQMDNPQKLIEATLLINPVSAIATALDLDILRTEWLYNHTSAPEYLFAYPSPLATAGVFAVIGLLAQMLAAWRLRRAYR